MALECCVWFSFAPPPTCTFQVADARGVVVVVSRWWVGWDCVGDRHLPAPCKPPGCTLAQRVVVIESPVAWEPGRAHCKEGGWGAAPVLSSPPGTLRRSRHEALPQRASGTDPLTSPPHPDLRFGGVKLGPSRFTLINNTARALLEKEVCVRARACVCTCVCARV